MDRLGPVVVVVVGWELCSLELTRGAARAGMREVGWLAGAASDVGRSRRNVSRHVGSCCGKNKRAAPYHGNLV
jgi:hypothetical protein